MVFLINLAYMRLFLLKLGKSAQLSQLTGKKTNFMIVFDVIMFFTCENSS